MNKCNNCKVVIENKLDECPLCSAKTEVISPDYVFSYPEIKKPYIYELINRILMLLAIGGSVVCLFINNYVGDIPWSFICVGGYFYLYFSAKGVFRKNNNLPLIVLVQITLISVLTVLIDYVIGWNGWSIDFVIPFIIIAGSVLLLVFGFITPTKYNEYIFYIFIITIIGAIPLVTLLFKVVTVKWPSLACFSYSIFTLLFMIIFSWRRFNNELKKRLHF